MYRFEIEYFRESAEGGQWIRRRVHPAYSENLKFTINRERDERFCRFGVDGTFTFTNQKDRPDFNFVSGLNETKCRFNIYNIDNPQKVILINSCPFTMEDIEFDFNLNEAVLKLKGKDRYENLLKSLDNEYDVVSLAPKKSTITMRRRPFIQFYGLHSSKLTNVMGNYEYEVDTINNAEERSINELLKMGFVGVKESENTTFQVDGMLEFYGYDLSFLEGGVFVIRNGEGRKYGGLGQSICTLKRVPNTDNIDYEVIMDKGKRSVLTSQGISRVFVVSTKGDKWYSLHMLDLNGKIIMRPGEGSIPDRADWYMDTRGTKIDRYSCYARVIVPTTVRDNVAEFVSPIASTDIYDAPLAYKRVLTDFDRRLIMFANPDFQQRVIIDDLGTSNPNEWKSKEVPNSNAARYFLPPSKIYPSDRIVPIAWDYWNPFAVWFLNDYMVGNNNVSPNGNRMIGINLREYEEPWELFDAYSIQEVARVLLGQIDSSIGFHSDFLDNIKRDGKNVNPISNVKNFHLFVTPITNIKKANYDMAAQRGKMTLKQLLEMMKTCFNCYWFLEDTETGVRMRLEHESWFEKGGTYGSPTIYRDLEGEHTRLSGNSWMRDLSSCNFEFGDVKSRYEYAWGDKETKVFNGFPINVENKYALSKTKEKKTISGFVADVDYIQTYPSSLSDDLFVVLGTITQGEGEGAEEVIVYEHPIGTQDSLGNISENHPIYNPQNGYLSFLYLEQTFLRDGKPSRLNMELDPIYDEEGKRHDERVAMNRSPWTCRVGRRKVVVPFRVEKADMCYEKLFVGEDIEWLSGTGRLEKLTINPFTNRAEIELSFDKII